MFIYLVLSLVLLYYWVKFLHLLSAIFAPWGEFFAPVSAACSRGICGGTNVQNRVEKETYSPRVKAHRRRGLEIGITK
jgi:hypothetical protein